jgi:hypothetical protein
LARLLCRLYDDCMVKSDFAGLSKLLSSRKAVHTAKEEARRRVQADLKDDEDEDDEGDDFDEEDEAEAKRYGEQMDLDHKMDALALQTRAPLDPHPEGQEDEGGGEEQKADAPNGGPAVEEEDGWTTVGKQKPKRKGK